jgi:hypothetical protein
VEIAEVASLIAEGTAAATALQLMAAVLTPIMIGIAILNAADTDKRLAGMQAIGYTLTAWAFGDPIPPFPRSLRANWSSFPGKQALPKVEQAWKDTSDATVRNLEAAVAKKRVHTRSYQLFWQVLGEGERKGLAQVDHSAWARIVRPRYGRGQHRLVWPTGAEAGKPGGPGDRNIPVHSLRRALEPARRPFRIAPARWP